MSQLPLQIRRDIRDVFDKEDGAVQKSFQKLTEVIGYPVSCDPEWHMLWTELESAYPDKAIFIPAIAKIVEAWSDSLAKRLEDDEFEAWTEVLLEKLKTVNVVKLSIQVGDETRLRTSWLGTKSAFVILLPKKTPFQPRDAASAFAGDFEKIFDPAKAISQAQEPQTQDDEDWADLASNADNKSLDIRTRPIDLFQPRTETLPSLQTLARPEILFQTTTPYLMQVSSSGLNKVTINGTHEPSLRLLAEYLQRWIKTDPQDVRKIPYLRIKLIESNFGLGLFHDSLTIEPFDHYQRHVVVNVSLILAFIQGVLGYQPILETSGACHWEFRRSAPFTTT